ncbi:uncharacterized protein LOC126904261 [Daktulosphaira vitifoliae]|uniref:uncharacterized protein LOC126904261 n=1 Tax=Daktulosphaira vitifoliae TaxID=58002 RepID=UPI0021AAC082|nr:uncharacterized protein LOC126904261 [Daktulosphaira vitifoliae]XP_050539104.1 uncharacterized protein LOC126904261 [Daktulosphaira vitifoliae]
MRAARTGGGSVCVVWSVVLAVLVMTATGASSKSTAATASAGTADSATSVVTASQSPTTIVSTTATTKMDKYNDSGECERVRVSIQAPVCTGQISEGPGPPRCPAACPNRSDNNNNNVKNINRQCLEYADRDLEEMCPSNPDAYRRPGRLSRYRLRHCCHHTVESVVQRAYNDSESCAAQVAEAIRMDNIAAEMSCQFNEVLTRYDCGQKYSSMSCRMCQESYALWACAAVLPHWTPPDEQLDRRFRVKSCRSLCLETEQKCPWLLPVADANPYAGEAAFTCTDPDIGYQMSAVDIKEDCCYEYCDDGLCIRNSSLCIDDRPVNSFIRTRSIDQRKVCIQRVQQEIEGSTCKDYSLSDSGVIRTSPTIILPLFLALLLPQLVPTQQISFRIALPVVT